MKKLKLFIVLALLPAVLTACGKTDAEKTKDSKKKAESHIAQAKALQAKINERAGVISQKSSDEDLKAYKAELEGFIYHMSEAIRIDDANTKLSWGSRDQAGRLVSEAKSYLALVNVELEKRAKAEEVAAAKKAM